MPAMLAVLGLALSIGLTASSIAIMGSVDASKGGAAGSLEATAYELGTGLGITVFGVFMSKVFGSTLSLPAELAPALAERAARSIGDSYVVAGELPAAQGNALIEAAAASSPKCWSAWANLFSPPRPPAPGSVWPWSSPCWRWWCLCFLGGNASLAASIKALPWAAGSSPATT